MEGAGGEGLEGKRKGRREERELRFLLCTSGEEQNRRATLYIVSYVKVLLMEIWCCV